jgi:hypothetical protein
MEYGNKELRSEIEQGAQDKFFKIWMQYVDKRLNRIEGFVFIQVVLFLVTMITVAIEVF